MTTKTTARKSYSKPAASASASAPAAAPRQAWIDLLETVATKPGVVSEAYNRFHNYSVGNQILALTQCWARGIEPGPMNTYKGWQRLGRQVQRGEKAIVLCQPLTVKSKDSDPDNPEFFTLFTYKPRWFVLAQTEGDDYAAPAPAGWDRARALAALNVTEVPFGQVDGNTMGYATSKGEVSVSPLAFNPMKTLFHELGHIVLGHIAPGQTLVDEDLPSDRAIIEAEAEAVALVCLDALNLDGADHCRGYIQGWLKGGRIPEKSAGRIFKAADAILRAGRGADEAEADEE